MKSVLQKYFDSSVNHRSPVLFELVRVVETDETGKEFVTYVPLDSQSVIKSNGKVSDWSLNNLIKAGISPVGMPVRTSSFVSRHEGVNEIDRIGQDVDAAFQSKEN